MKLRVLTILLFIPSVVWATQPYQGTATTTEMNGVHGTGPQAVLAGSAFTPSSVGPLAGVTTLNTILFASGATDINASITSLCQANPGSTIIVPTGNYTTATTGDWTYCNLAFAGESAIINYTGNGVALAAYVPYFTGSATFTASTKTISATGIGSGVMGSSLTNRPAPIVLLIQGTSHNPGPFTIASFSTNSITVNETVVNEGPETIYAQQVSPSGSLFISKVSGGKLVGTLGTNANAVGILVSGTQRAEIDSMHVTNFGSHGAKIWADGALQKASDVTGRNNNNTLVANSNFSYNGQGASGGDGIIFGGPGGVENGIAFHNYVAQNGSYGIVGTYGLSLASGNAENQAATLDFGDNFIQSNGLDSIMIDGIFGFHAHGNMADTMLISPNKPSFGIQVDADNSLGFVSGRNYVFEIVNSTNGSNIANGWEAVEPPVGDAFAIFKTSSNTRINVPDCTGVVMDPNSAVNNVQCTDSLGINAYMSGPNYSTLSLMGFGTQYPSSQAQIPNSGKMTVEAQPPVSPYIYVTSFSDSGTSGGSFTYGHRYSVQIVWVDSTGARSPLGPAVTGTNTIGQTLGSSYLHAAVYWTGGTTPPLPAGRTISSVEFYCVDLTANPDSPPTFCGTEAYSSGTHSNYQLNALNVSRTQAPACTASSTVACVYPTGGTTAYATNIGSTAGSSSYIGGNSIVTGTQLSTYGPALWAASGTSCTTACTGEGLTCVTAATLSGTSETCSYNSAALLCQCN